MGTMEGGRMKILAKEFEVKRDNRMYKEVAKETGMPLSTIWRIENFYIPNMANFLKVCRWLEMAPEEFAEYKIVQKNDQKKTWRHLP